MSDGREGCVEYIPLNDMDHPIVSVGEEVRQVDEDCTAYIWFKILKDLRRG